MRKTFWAERGTNTVENPKLFLLESRVQRGWRAEAGKGEGRKKAGEKRQGQAAEVWKGPKTQACEVCMFLVGNEKPLESLGLVTWLCLGAVILLI